jgi:hypothetical protein
LTGPEGGVIFSNIDAQGEARRQYGTITAYGRFRADVSVQFMDVHISQVKNLEETIDSDM